MEVEKITPAGRRWQRVAMRLAIFAALYAALKVNILFEGSGLISLLIIVAAFFLAFYFTSREWLKIVFVSLAAWFLLFGGFIYLAVRGSHVSASAISPDGQVVAELLEVPAFGEHHFVVRLKTKDGRGNHHYRDLFRSPDEARPEAECFLWSKDGRYLLLLGTRFGAMRNEAYLASGERLYLLADTEKDVVYYNTTQVRPERPFSVDDLAGIDFGVSIPNAKITNEREAKVCPQQETMATGHS